MNLRLYLVLILWGLAPSATAAGAGDMVEIRAGGSQFSIDRFEASLEPLGDSGGKAMSVAGRVPATQISFVSAKAACARAGKRLCKAAEWKTACKGDQQLPAGVKDPVSLAKDCDVSRSDGRTHSGMPSNTGSRKGCHPQGYEVFDLVGNCAEWVEDASGAAMIVGVTYYDTYVTDQALLLRQACDRILAAPGQVALTQVSEGLGFRCCK